MSSPIFTTNEIFVCLHEKDGSKFPYSAKIMAIKEIGSIQFYMIHYSGWKSTTDIRIPVGEEAGRMYKGSLKEYGEKFHVDISPDAWDAEKKCKRKAVDDLERSFVKKERIQEENVYRKVYVPKRRKLREDSEEATSSDALRRSRGDPGATTSEVKDSRISKDKEYKAKSLKQRDSENQVKKTSKVIPIDEAKILEGQGTSTKIRIGQTEENLHKEDEIQNLKPGNPEELIHEPMNLPDQSKEDILAEIQNLPQAESPKKRGPIEKVPDSEVAKKVQDKDSKVNIPVSEYAVQKKRNNPGYYIPKNDSVYNERMSVLRARHAGTLDEVKLTDWLGKILVDDYIMVHSEKKIPKVPAEWVVVNILEEYKNSKTNDSDSYGLNDLNTMILFYMDKHFRSLCYSVEVPNYEQRLIQEALRQKLIFEDVKDLDPKIFKASEHYGLVHLLRLLTEIDKFVMMYNTGHSLERTRTILIDFMKFLDIKKYEFYHKEKDYMDA